MYYIKSFIYYPQKSSDRRSDPDCYQFDVTMLFDNSDHDGQMLLSLDAEPIRLHCQGDTEVIISTAQYESFLATLVNLCVILICLISFALCTRALYRAVLLRQTTVAFFRDTYAGQELSREGRCEFVNFWYVMIIGNDVLLVIGSAMKEQIERSDFTTDRWNVCSVLLGLGNMLVWFGVLRYLGFFKAYNVVILTLKQSAPKIMRFLFAALLIYAGFVFCGWLVLGPYHFKFRSLSVTSECLFAMINGDELFPTFETLATKSLMLWWFCRIYLYSFLCLYIYVVLSLFISVIMDAYDTVKIYHRDGFPLNDLRRFMGPTDLEEFAACDLEQDEHESMADWLRSCWRCGCWRRHEESVGPTGYVSMSASWR